MNQHQLDTLFIKRLLINRLTKVYQVGDDSLMYHDSRSTKHQIYNQHEFEYVYDAGRGCITRLHKLFYLVPIYKFVCFHTSWYKNPKDSPPLFHCLVDYIGKGTPTRTEGPVGGRRGIALLFLYFGARRGWVVSTTPRPL
jgi:hypothetical protein